MTPSLSYGETSAFKKDFQRLLKKFRSLKADLELAKVAVIELFHLREINNLSTFPLIGFSTNHIQIYKIKKFACRSLKGRGAKSGLRVIYAFHCDSLQVDLIEIYFKGDQENENRERILEYLKKFNT